MPRDGRWRTWDAVFTDLYRYRSSPAFQRHFLVELGYLLPCAVGGNAKLCLGSSFAWCNRLLQYPNETPFERLKYLEENPAVSLEPQLLHQDTATCVPYGKSARTADYFNSLAQAEEIQLKFELAFGVHFPELEPSLSLLAGQIESDSVYCLALNGHTTKPPIEQSNHVLALAKMADNSAHVFENAQVEFTIEQDRLGQFFGDIFQANLEIGCAFFMLTAFKVSRKPAEFVA